MKVLVTGGAGFIGSTVVDKLILNEHEVSVVDNLSTGKRGNVNNAAKFYEVDLRNFDSLAAVFEKEKPEAVFHLAAQINVRSSIKDPAYDASVNVLGSLNLLECCRKYGVKKVIYSSSGGAVYGEPKELPVRESHPISPLSQYGASKYAVEKYLDVYGALYGFEFVILRYGNVYGPRQDPLGEAGVIAIFTNKMLSNEALLINDNGDQTRDFVYVEDVAEANILALEKGKNKEAYNIGTGKPSSVNDIVHGLEKAISSKAVCRNLNAIPGEVKHIYSDISKARSHLGFEPKTDLESGLAKTVQWAKSICKR